MTITKFKHLLSKSNQKYLCNSFFFNAEDNFAYPSTCYNHAYSKRALLYKFWTDTWRTGDK